MAEVEASRRGNGFIDLTGQCFGKLTVIRESPKRGRAIMWLCLCDCGREHSVSGTVLRKGMSKSCGCGKAEACRRSAFKHGGVGTTEYAIYHGILKRCYDRNATGYDNYGGRGIVMCDRWLGSEGFVNFLADMGKRPSRRHSIERLRPSEGYGPDNCEWTTYDRQARNKRTTRRLTFNGETMSVADWADRAGLRSGTISKRLQLGWTVEEALTTPV